MRCPKCRSENNYFLTLWFKYCWKCEQESERLKFNTHKE